MVVVVGGSGGGIASALVVYMYIYCYSMSTVQKHKTCAYHTRLSEIVIPPYVDVDGQAASVLAMKVPREPAFFLNRYGAPLLLVYIDAGRFRSLRIHDPVDVDLTFCPPGICLDMYAK